MIGKKLKSLLIEKGLSQKKLAEKMSLTPQAINLWIKDKADPDILNLKLLAKILEVSVDEILESEEDKYYFEYRHKNATLIHIERNKKNV